MTKRRKIKSTLSSEPKPRFVRAVLAAALGIVVAVGLGPVASTQAATINVPADYATIQAAVAAASPGDTIMVAPGDYTGAEIFKTVKVHGSGPSTRITTGVGYFLDGFGIYAPGVEISNLAIDVVGKTFTPGVNIRADNATVRDVEITVYSDQHGISAVFAEGARIEGNTVSTKVGHAGHRGIVCYRSPNAVVTDNEISGTYLFSIVFETNPNSVVTGNTIICEGDIGIVCQDSPDIEITDNTIEGTYTWDGIYLAISDAANVSGNTIGGTYDKGRGIYLRYSDAANVSGNTISGRYHHGIYSDESSNPIVTGNTIISEAAHRGIECRACPNIKITDNKIEGTYKEHCIRFRRSDAANVSGNTISGTFSRGIACYKSSNAIITGNTISGTWENGIRTYRSSNSIITGNTISGTGQAGIKVKARSAGITIAGNTIKNFRGDRSWSSPICVEESQNCTVIDNELIDVYHGTVLAGIRISGLGIPCENNNLLGNYFRQSGLPGLTAQSDGPFCVMLEEGTKNNFVKEQGGYPQGTDAKTQVFDGGYLYQDDYGNWVWTTTNRVVGHDASQLAQQEDLNPGIGQRLKAIRDASGESEEEEEGDYPY